MNAPAETRGAGAPRITPRVVTSGGAAIRIETVVCELVATGKKLMGIIGGPGSGKTTALRYLEQCLSDLMLVYFDHDATEEVVWRSIESGNVVVVTSTSDRLWAKGATLTLAGWGRDELLEWAIGEPPERRRSFVERAMLVMDECDGAAPEVLGAIWRELSEDELLADFRSAANAALGRRMGGHTEAVEIAGFVAWHGLSGGEHLVGERLNEYPKARKLTRHRAIAIASAAQWAAFKLAAGDMVPLWRRTPIDLIREIGERVGHFPSAESAIVHALGESTNGAIDMMGASILNLAGSDWRPGGSGRAWRFGGAVLSGARWAGVSIVGSDLEFADLRGASLGGADLSGVRAKSAKLAQADLRNARMVGAALSHADLRGADLRGADLEKADLERAILDGVDLSKVRARGARIVRASLRDARLGEADLGKARIVRCDLEGACLARAVLSGARLWRLDLRNVQIDDTSLADATVVRCNFSELLATGMNARGAKFRECDLTGSVLRCAGFARATFAGCGLAEIWWQGADLRDADFRGSTFHMGSSRCGLVGSTIAGEGSRTGFYTDDYNQQDYRPPEEISKADLRGADLRGAIVEGVDFYLVDLRGALFDEKQGEWFRKCGAILGARV